MAIQYINTGSSANAGNGDSLRSAFIKVNNNFAYLSTATFGAGANGYTGSQGDIGFVGSRGDTGFTGSQGPAGPGTIVPGNPGRLAFFISTGSTIAQTSGITYSTVTQTLVIGDSANTSTNVFWIRDSYSAAQPRGWVFTQHYDNSDVLNFTWNRTRGTFANPTSVITDDDIADLVFTTQIGTTPIDIAAITVRVENTSTGVPSGKFMFFTNPGTTSTSNLVSELSSTGTFKFTKIGALVTGTNLIVESSLVPDQDSVRSLGSSANQWHSLYVSSSTVYINRTPVTIDNAGTLLVNGSSVLGTPGYSGSRGNLGYTGSRGDTGSTGTQGSIGYSGSKGDLGYTGSRGIDGYAGSKGDIGYTGSEGTPGQQGNRGYTGSEGLQGTPGLQGQTGAQGINIVLVGSTTTVTTSTVGLGTAGQGWINTTDGDVYFWNTGTQLWENIGPIVGPQGDLGYTGSKGDQGNIGLTGDPGFTGSQGINGYDGSQGDPGYVGSQGELGYTGSQGDLGYVGSQGETGYTGSQGELGYTGSQGEVGYVGSTGSRGFQGYTGSQGDTGYVGSLGDIGYTGSRGNIGYTGSAGIDTTSTLYSGTLTVVLNVTGDLVPNTDNLQDLGSTTNRFRHVYVGPGSVYIGNNVITESATGGLVLPGVTRATGYRAEEVEEKDSWGSNPTITGTVTVIDANRYDILSGRPASANYNPATYTVEKDGNRVEEINVDESGSGWTKVEADYARDNNMYATNVVDAINNFNASDWVQIPFRVEVKAEDTEYEDIFGGGTALPSQSGQEGKFLTTDGEELSWATVSGGEGDGYTGSRGYTGSQGTAGYTGSAGIGSIGYTGSAGTSGSSTSTAVTVSDTAPTATTGTQWFNTIDGRIYIAYSGQWVDASPVVVPQPSTYLDEITIDGSTININDNTLTISNTGTLLINGAAVTGSGVSVSNHIEYTDPTTDYVSTLDLTYDFAVDVDNAHLDINGDGNWEIGSNNFDTKIFSTNDPGNEPKVIVVSADNEDWTFGPLGMLTLPQGSIISEAMGAIRLTPPAASSSTQALLIYPTVVDGNHVHLTAGGGDTDLYLGNDDQFVKIDHGGDIVVQTYSTATTSTWTFGTDGVLTLPNDMTIDASVSFGIVTIGGTSTYISIDNGGAPPALTIATNQGENAWQFGYDGVLTLSTASTILGNSSDPNVYIETATTATAINTWTFAADGGLTLPNGATIVDTTSTLVLTPNSPAQVTSLVLRSTYNSYMTADYPTDQGYQQYLHELDPVTYPDPYVSTGTEGTVISITLWDASGLQYVQGDVEYIITGTGITAADFTPAVLTGTFAAANWTLDGGGFNYTNTNMLMIANDAIVEGEETFTVTIITTGTYAPGAGSNYLRVNIADGNTEGSESGHIHLISENMAQTSIFLGNDDKYVKVAADDQIYIKVPNADTSATSQLWTFAGDGSLTLPDGGDIKNSSGTSVLTVVTGQETYEFDGVNTTLTITNVTFNLLFCTAAVGYSGSDGHTVLLPAGTAGQRLVIVNISSLCTLTVDGAIDGAVNVAPEGTAELIYLVGAGVTGWWPLYGTTLVT